MKCEYCDSIIQEVPDNGVCPNCGGTLPADVAQKLELEKYYYRFPTSRLQAIKALRNETGMSLAGAKRIIDKVFAEKMLEQQVEIKAFWGTVRKSDLNEYYSRYPSSRYQAVKALQRDTGLGIKEAQSIIDEIFDEATGTKGGDLSVSWGYVKDSFKDIFRSLK